MALKDKILEKQRRVGRGGIIKHELCKSSHGVSAGTDGKIHLQAEIFNHRLKRQDSEKPWQRIKVRRLDATDRNRHKNHGDNKQGNGNNARHLPYHLLDHPLPRNHGHERRVCGVVVRQEDVEHKQSDLVGGANRAGNQKARKVEGVLFEDCENGRVWMGRGREHSRKLPHELGSHLKKRVGKTRSADRIRSGGVFPRGVGGSIVVPCQTSCGPTTDVKMKI